MLRVEPKQFSMFGAAVYSRIPEDNMLKKLEQTIDFSFINEPLADSYYGDLGRPAKEPELLMRRLFLKHINYLLDVQVTGYETHDFTFDNELCISCPHRAECTGRSRANA